MLDDLGLVHMNGRIYDPLLGRFLSPDPIIQFPNDLQNYNRYTYALNNPLKYTDPTGNANFLIHFLSTLVSELLHGRILDALPVAYFAAARDFSKLPDHTSSQAKVAEAANVHAMIGQKDDGKTPQTKAEARLGAQAIVDRERAKDADRSASVWERWKARGYAYHTIEDNHSPEHKDYKSWANGYGGFGGWLKHTTRDLFMTPSEYKDLFQAAFKTTEGIQLTPVRSGGAPQTRTEDANNAMPEIAPTGTSMDKDRN
jgi:RHS repeat-associated protein